MLYFHKLIYSSEQRLKNYTIVDYFDKYVGDNGVDDAIQFGTCLMVIRIIQDNNPMNYESEN